jgi:hypothetical protein
MTTISTPAATATHDRPTRSTGYVVMRVLLGIIGVFSVFAASYFGFVLDASDGGISNGFDLFVTLWKIGIGLAMLTVAVGPGLSRGGRLALARWAIGAELVFDAIKLGYYHESAAVLFTVVDCALLALVLRVSRKLGVA